MKITQGFSLAEVLVSLLLVTGTSLALLKQQWQTGQFVNQVRMRADALIQLDNASEQWITRDGNTHVPKPFQLTMTQTDHDIELQITWQSPSLVHNDACMLQRHLVML